MPRGPANRWHRSASAKRVPVLVAAVLPTEGKTRITIYLDDVVIERFKAISEKSGKGYQTLVNEALRAHLGVADAPLTVAAFRRILREELSQHG